jgi:hypothetical protein
VPPPCSGSPFRAQGDETSPLPAPSGAVAALRRAHPPGPASAGAICPAIAGLSPLRSGSLRSIPASLAFAPAPRTRYCERGYLANGVSEEVATLARTWVAWAWAVRGCVRQNAAGRFSGDRAISGIGLIFEIPASGFHEREMKRSWHAIPAFLRTQPRGIMAPRREFWPQTRSCERGYWPLLRPSGLPGGTRVCGSSLRRNLS